VQDLAGVDGRQHFAARHVGEIHLSFADGMAVDGHGAALQR